MSLYVADTHALLWYLSGSAQISSSARDAFEEAEKHTSDVVIPAIVLAEAVMLIEKRRVPLDVTLLVSAVKAHPHFHFAPLSPEVALQIRALTTLDDIHDRLIVAETLARGATLISRDSALRDSGLVSTLW